MFLQVYSSFLSILLIKIVKNRINPAVNNIKILISNVINQICDIALSHLFISGYNQH